MPHETDDFNFWTLRERVLRRLGVQQSNLCSHTSSWNRDLGAESKKALGQRMQGYAQLLDPSQSPSLIELYSPHNELSYSPDSYWRGLCGKPARPGPLDLIMRPLFFATGSTPAHLAKQLERVQKGRALAHVGIDEAADFSRFSQYCSALMDGRLVPGSSAEAVCATVMMTDPNALLGEVIRSGKSSARWVQRMFWLVDGNAGPEPNVPTEFTPPPGIGTVEERYEKALGTIVAERIDNQNRPRQQKCDCQALQADWVNFLKGLEPECPGILGAARSLLVDLIFGIREMVRAEATPKGFELFIDHVGALARFLAHRMANAYAVMSRAEEIERQQQLESAILFKLEDGPLSIRSLCRKFHRLPAPQCLELLMGLEGTGQVTRHGDRWNLTNPSGNPKLTLEA
jgi:hypothetical protein